MKAAARIASLGCLACLTILSSARPAAAEVTAGQRATAEALFQQAVELMEQKKFSQACEQFAASQELDPALGTTLYLADCYEQTGKTASAWALFQEGADVARRAQQSDREQIANERAASLKGRLSKLELRVPAARRVQGLELRINDIPVPSASWNTAMPVDPGKTRVEARAPGKKPWSVEVNVAVGPSSQVVEMAQLSDGPQPMSTDSAGELAEKLAPHDPGATQRTIGYVVGAVGVVGLAVGGYFGYRAMDLNKQSKAQCRADDPNACTSEGAAMRQDAQSAATVSTISSIGGGVLVGTGLTLVLTAPSAHSTRAGSAPGQASSPGFGVQLRGVW
jgi:tetratricopeptide (TPR) repeat protein